MKKKKDIPRAAFVCVHNSCRSQIAEALGKLYAGDVFTSFSAGTEPAPRIDPDAVRLLKDLHGIDMEKTQRPKAISELPPVDIVVKIGCDIVCPYLPGSYEENWEIGDPSGKPDGVFVSVIGEIERRIRQLAEKITNERIGIT